MPIRNGFVVGVVGLMLSSLCFSQDVLPPQNNDDFP